jgi:basic membrane lipoprotein Med (substrate-binding protein (PBP1-ABC) superfamily)
MPPPTDDELSAMTGVTNSSIVAGLDKESYDAWRAVGFSHEEAFALLIANKQGTIYATIDVNLKKEEA